MTCLLSGDNGLREFEKRTAGGGNKKKATQKTDVNYGPDNFRIYFPSQETVRQSRGGQGVSYAYSSEKYVRICLMHHSRLGVLYAYNEDGGKHRRSLANWSATVKVSEAAS